SETRFNAAFTLNKLCADHKNIDYVGQSGAIPRLVDVLSTGTKEAKAQVKTYSHLPSLPLNLPTITYT
ncbi:hypothetical protein B484DRAFT_390394, partial [Ochromonadaceae sp. CCMP2298]